MKTCAAVILVALLVVASAARGEPPPDRRIDRLVHLAKLWGVVKYGDPLVWTRDVDLDRLLLDAVPKVSAATTASEYRAAVAAMLGKLDDPATRVLDEASGSKPTPLAEVPVTRIENGVLIVSVRRLSPFGDNKEVNAAIVAAHAIVFDLRGVENVENWVADGFFDKIGNIYSRRTLLGPVERALYHDGYQSQDGSGSGGYMTTAVTTAATEYPPQPGAHARSIVFLVGDGSPMPHMVHTLVAAGEAWLVSDGHFVVEQTKRVEMGEGVVAVVRVTELNPTLRVDVEVGGGKDPLAAALALARGTRKKAAASPSPFAPIVWRADKLYADTPYPAKEMRLLALFRYWNIIHYFYAYSALIGDWDAVLPRFIPRFEDAADTLAYQQAFAELMTQVPDGHSFINGGAEALRSWIGVASPQVELRQIEAKWVFTKARAGLGLSAGDVLVAIDGQPVERRAELVGRYVAGSTPGGHATGVSYRLLSGPFSTPFKVTVVGADGHEREVELPRGPKNEMWEPWPTPAQDDIVKILPGNIGYVDLRYLEVPDVDAMFAKLEHTRAIIFDMRGYPHETMWAIAPRINKNHARVAARFETPVVEAGEMVRTIAEQEIDTSDAPIYTNPTVMLIDERTISQAEHTGLFFEAASGTKFVGTPTAGANGDVTTISIPGGISVSMTGHDIRHADGRQLQRIGLVPDLLVAPTIAGLRAGKDEVLDAAIHFLDDGAASAAHATATPAP